VLYQGASLYEDTERLTFAPPRHGVPTIHPNFKVARWLSTLVTLVAASWSGDLGAAPMSAAVISADSEVQAGVKAAYAQFIAGNNAHDPSAVSDVLLNSPDFVWAQYAGNSVWGRAQAVAADFREG
jgi:hypothetical protein